MITSRTRSIMTALLGLAALAINRGTAHAEEYQITGPFIHENLALYMVRGGSAAGRVPMTLEEATADGTLHVVETKDVNELLVENNGDSEVFIQSGEIVQGGLQDRAMAVSLLLPPHSGQIPIAAFCVESGRWAARGSEDSRTLQAAGTALPLRGTKALAASAYLASMLPPARALAATPAPASPQARQAQEQLARLLAERSQAQALVWSEASRMQTDLQRGLRADPAAPKSPTSLALTLDDARLQEMEKAFVKALLERGAEGADVVGYVFAINGRLSAAQIYESNGLFRKLWPKQLRAAAAEAIAGAEPAKDVPRPSIAAVKSFLAQSSRGDAKALTAYVMQEIHDDAHKVSVETRRSSGRWVARSYQEK